jgi:phosphorylcholine metabolism protein LicD
MTAQVDAFRLAAKVLDEVPVRWWLSDGSVLGAVREGRFLAGDLDVDLGVWLADMPVVRAAFLAAGWPISRDRPGQLWAVHDGVKVDVHGHQRDRGRVWYELSRGKLAYRFPARLFDTLAAVELHGVHTRMPSPPEDYLVAHYGDWTVPRKRWRWNVDPPCLVRMG